MHTTRSLCRFLPPLCLDFGIQHMIASQLYSTTIVCHHAYHQHVYAWIQNIGYVLIIRVHYISCSSMILRLKSYDIHLKALRNGTQITRCSRLHKLYIIYTHVCVCVCERERERERERECMHVRTSIHTNICMYMH